MSDLDTVLHGSPYVGYAYSYPHKSAYRAFDPPILLEDIWSREPHDSLFLYLHVPFCEYRCGFCNLFTIANGNDEWVDRYLSQLRHEASVLLSVIPKAKFARLALGGGTPTFLDEGNLSKLLATASSVMGCERSNVPTSCEASPATLTDEKARLLRAFGVDRISLGVQTFDDREAQSLGRPQSAIDVERAIDIVRRAEIPLLNLDLIYGSRDQTLHSWMATVKRAIQHEPEEVFLYPLYVRELTGLGRIGAVPRDDRLASYRGGRDALLDAGYQQVSMRMFRKPVPEAADVPVYCCQSDGMVGLGCGARSYTREIHYSTEFAVGRSGVRSILEDYLHRSTEIFRYAHHGYRLDAVDQKRRFVLQGLLQAEGQSIPAYAERFATSLLDDFPELQGLLANGLGRIDGDRLRLTTLGLERSDAVGPWLYSPQVVELMESNQCV